MNRQEEASAQPQYPRRGQERMVEVQLARRGIHDQRVLEAFRRVPRGAFVPAEFESEALDDGPLYIGHGQTISQPYVVALMSERLRLRPRDRVLEIGTGSGYAAAILGELVKEVHSVERIEALCKRACERLEQLGYGHVHVHCGDGQLGWPPGAPYDAISVTAATAEVPPALVEQLAVGGRMVIPVGPPGGAAAHALRAPGGWDTGGTAPGPGALRPSARGRGAGLTETRARGLARDLRPSF